ncbi:MAG: molybdate ABC transporter permease subunit, partial [Salinibacterium sp.]
MSSSETVSGGMGGGLGSAGRPARRGFLAPALWLPAALALALLTLPLLALVTRAPWAELPQLLSRTEVSQALGLSLGTATTSTALCLVLGIPLALVLARSAGWPLVPRRLLRALITVPL